MDDYVREHKLQSIDLIKCDVEGAELLVLQGAQHALRAFKPVLILEVSELWVKRYGYTVAELWAFLQALDYRAWAIDEQERQIRQVHGPQECRGNVLFRP